MIGSAPLDLEAVERAATHLATARRAMAFTGAGISVESGIPDFRSDDGLWRRFPPERFATIDVFRATPERSWVMLRAMLELVIGARPNPGHDALARMEAEGLIRGVVTQNVDSLHQVAGSREVIEVHGSCRGLHCGRCRFRDPGATAPADGVPTCPRCGAPLKPPLVLFHEDLPEQAMALAWSWAAEADLVLVVGTSLAVWPAADIPMVAAGNGAVLVEVNRRTGHIRDHDAIELRGSSSEILPALLERTLALRA